MFVQKYVNAHTYNKFDKFGTYAVHSLLDDYYFFSKKKTTEKTLVPFLVCMYVHMYVPVYRALFEVFLINIFINPK